MKSSGIIAFFGLLAVAVTQSTTGNQQSVTASLSPQVSCALNCNPNDICCRANCAHVPCPNNLMANQTTACVAGCPQGNGSVADTANYSKCIQNCYSSLFFPGSVTTGASGSGATNVSGGGSSISGGSGGSGTNTGSSTGTATGATTSTSKAAAASYQKLQLGASGAGLLGLILAAFAL